MHVSISRRKEAWRLGDLLTSGPSNCFVDPSYFSFDAREVLNSNYGLVSCLIMEKEKKWKNRKKKKNFETKNSEKYFF